MAVGRMATAVRTGSRRIEAGERMRAWAAYSALGLLIAAGGVIVAGLAAPGSAKAVGFSALLAWLLQVGAFAALVRVRERAQLFMVVWLGGIVLRFGAVGVVAFWVTRTEALPPATTLLSLVAFVFVLLLLEPVFLRKGLPTG